MHGGHFGLVFGVAVLLLTVSWVKNPQLFSVLNFHNTGTKYSETNVPRYYAYEVPAEFNQPQVAGASTQDQGPMIINDDGSVTPVDIGKVLGASTKGVELSLDSVKVNTVSDSELSIKKYFDASKALEQGAINQADFASALNSGNQEQINVQANKLILVKVQLGKLAVPQSLVKLQKLKIIQYESAIALLQNFTLADQNTDLIGQNLQQFLKSQEDLDAENAIIAQKFPQESGAESVYEASQPETVSSQPDSVNPESMQLQFDNLSATNAAK